MIQNMNYILVLEDKTTGKTIPVEGEMTLHKDGTCSVRITNWSKGG